MNKHFTALALASALLAFATPALAQQKTHDHGTHQPAATAPAAVAEMTEGEIRKVDKEAKKLTIRHGEIKNLDMPAMTMVFQIKDSAMLDTLKAGDKVRFTVEKAASGYVVTDIRPAP